MHIVGLFIYSYMPCFSSAAVECSAKNYGESAVYGDSDSVKGGLKGPALSEISKF